MLEFRGTSLDFRVLVFFKRSGGRVRGLLLRSILGGSWRGGLAISWRGGWGSSGGGDRVVLVGGRGVGARGSVVCVRR